MSLSHNPTISGATPDRAGLPDRLRAGSGPGVALFSFLLVVLMGNAHGGYYPTAWGWSVLVFAWIAGLAYAGAGRRALDWLERTFVVALSLLLGWTALSVAWTSDVDASVMEVQRGLVYLFGALAALLVVRRGSVAHLLGGLVAGTTWLSVQALADRLSADEGAGAGLIVHDRLDGALGYATGFGLLGVMGALLALGLAVHARSPLARAAAAATLPVLLTATYFTFSRGAILAIAAGLLAALALDRRRLTLLTAGALVALPSAAAVWIASREPALTSSRAAADLITEEGRELALVLLVVTVVSALAAAVVGLAQSRVRVSPGARRTYGAVVTALAVVMVVGAVMSQGGPGPLVDKAYNGVNQDKLPADQAEANDLNSRLGSIGTTARVSYWRVAWDQYEDHPLVGAGAGTFEQFWLRDRPIGEAVIDAHSLYLETLAQLGWPGLVLLLAMLAAPLAAALQARGEPLAAAAFGAYVAYLVHTGIDWDWEMPVLTLFALLCAAALFAAARDGRAAWREGISPRGRTVAITGLAALVAFSVVGLVGQRALAEADDALRRGDPAAAEGPARTAQRWAPWSAEAQRQLGRAQVGLGRAEEGRRTLREAARRTPDDWRIWYDLGIASTGRQRERAFVEAATRNPLELEIQALRERGHRLPSRRPRR